MNLDVVLERTANRAGEFWDFCCANGELPLAVADGTTFVKERYIRYCVECAVMDWIDFTRQLLPAPETRRRFCPSCHDDVVDLATGEIETAVCDNCFNYSRNYWKARRIALAWWREPTAVREGMV